MDTIERHLNEVVEAIQGLDAKEIAKVVYVLQFAKIKLATVWLVGNGGSASTASHFANDLIKQCVVRAISIPDMVSMITAYANDEGAPQMFSSPLKALYPTPHDVAIVFSCSGLSQNINNFLSCWSGGPVIVFTGNNTDTPLSYLAKSGVVVRVPHPSIFVQETVHLAVCHAIVDTLKRMKPPNDSADAMAYALKQNSPYSD